jgi:hypothetical protein
MERHIAPDEGKSVREPLSVVLCVAASVLVIRLETLDPES